MVRRRGVGRGRERTEVHILVITWATGCGARRTEGTGRAEWRGLQATGGQGSRGRQGEEMVVDRQRGSFEQRRSEGSRRVKRWRGHCQQRRMASEAAGDEGKRFRDTDPPRKNEDPGQQRLGRWDTGAPTDADIADGQQGAGGASQCEAPDEWNGSEEDGICAGDRNGRGVQRRKRERWRLQRLREHQGGRHSSSCAAPMEGSRTAGVCQQPGGAKVEGCSVTQESHYQTWRNHTRRMEVGVSAQQVLRHDGTGIRAPYTARGSMSRRAHQRGRTTV